MNPWLALAAFVAWTSAVWYYADRHGEARAEQSCQRERDKAAQAKQQLEAGHANAGRKFEEDHKHDEALIDDLRGQLLDAAKNDPVPAGCSLGAERLRIWNAGNAGPSHVPGEPPGEVPDRLPAATVR